MSKKNVFLYDIDVPEVVQKKAETAFSMIRTEGENNMKNGVDSKKKKGRKTQIKKHNVHFRQVLTGLAACAAAAGLAVCLKAYRNPTKTDIAENETAVENDFAGGEKEGENFLAVIDNMFTLQVRAAELEEGQPVPLVDNAQPSGNDSQINGRQAESWVMGGTDEGDLDYCINLPLSCTGNNIEKVTYSINQGAFQIVQPEGESIIIDGQLHQGDINANNVGMIGGDFNEETGLASYTYETVFYQSFTLDYRKQTDEYTWINICNHLSGKAELQHMIWGEGDNLEEMNRGIQEMLGNTVITCTVQYQDGTTQSADILVSSRIMTCAEAGAEVKEDPDREELFITFELQGEKIP